MAINFSLYRTDGNLDGRFANPDNGGGGGLPPIEGDLATWADNFSYAGAFKVPKDVGGGTLAFSNGMIGASSTSGNMYISLKDDSSNRGIAELSLPALSTSTDINDLNIATEVQGRFNLFDTPDGNPDNNDRIGALYGTGNDLIYTLIEFYDAPANNTLFFGKAGGSNNFATATLNNQIGIEGDFRAAGWISEVPANLQAELGYTHIAGNASNWSIIGRASVGPSAYGFNISDAINRTDPIPTETFQSYSLENQIQHNVNPVWSLNNTLDRDAVPIVPQDNDLWTFGSKASFGFIVPNSRTYAVFGSTFGTETGVGYKNTNAGGLAPGYAPADATDWRFFRWFFDVDDWIAVKNGTKQPHEIIPYEYGEIDLPFKDLRGEVVGVNGLQMRGGMFDTATNRVYLSVVNNEQRNEFSPVPLVYAFDIGG